MIKRLRTWLAFRIEPAIARQAARAAEADRRLAELDPTFPERKARR